MTTVPPPEDTAKNKKVYFIINGYKIYIDIDWNPEKYETVEAFVENFKKEVLSYLLSEQFDADSGYVAMLSNSNLKWKKANTTLRNMWHE